MQRHICHLILAARLAKYPVTLMNLEGDFFSYEHALN